jgi:SagB-type dehydrogenase family enzyme
MVGNTPETLLQHQTNFSMQTLNLEHFFKLPKPRDDGPVSVEGALMNRRSIRAYRKDPLTLTEIAQLTWSAQGVSDPRGYRTAPSAGALYPLEIYLIAGWIDELRAGIYKYDPSNHGLRKIVDGDRRKDLSRAALNQNSIANAPAVLLLCTVDERVTNKYGHRGIRYVFMEIGHAAQNLCLQAVALGLATVVIGAFRDSEIKKIAHLVENERPAYIVPIGRSDRVKKEIVT